MNLIEAVKSGKSYKRKKHTYWYESSNKEFHLSIQCILADDWEVESEPLMITRAQFDEAWYRAIVSSAPATISQRNLLAKELGL